MELAVRTGISPREWEEAGIQAILTAVEVLNEQAKQ